MRRHVSVFLSSLASWLPAMISCVMQVDNVVSIALDLNLFLF